MIHIQPATPETLAKTPVGTPAWTVRAVVGVNDDGAVVGAAGVFMDNYRTVMWAYLEDAMRADKRAMVRGIRAVQGLVKPGMTVQSRADSTIPGAHDLLRHMGFRQVNGEIYEWHS